ncbi:MAG TPA: VWA domain-containing protein [Vicinamibacterales bacterium]|jgi:VWFA-related protein
MRSVLTIAASAAALTAAAAAQSVPDRAPDPSPHPVRVEAIVTDKNGKPILNLRPEDFSIIDNGTSYVVVSATMIGRLATTTAQASARTAPAAPSTMNVSSIGTPDDERRAAREDGARIVGLYLDEFHVSAGANTERVRAAAARFVDELRPSDLFVLLKPLDQLTDIRFTRNRDAARQVIASFSGRKDDYTPRTTFEEQYMGRSAAAVRSARAQIVLSGLRAMATRIGELGGGLSGIVVFTEGFAPEGARSRERRLPDLQGLVRAASRSRLMVYPFDPSDVASPSDALEPLRGVARQTGGEPLALGEDLNAGLLRVSRDLDGYYVLTYRSTSPDDGRFHELQVASTRRDARVRARSGYWAPLPEMRLARSVAPALIPMRAVRRSPLIEYWFGTMMEPDGRRRVIFTWAPAPVSSTSKPIARPELVNVKVSTPAGQVLFEGDVSAAHTGSAGGRRTNSAVFDAAIGRLQFDLTILRADGGTLDTSAQDFDVPELRGPAPVIFQPQLFSAASAREFREIVANSNAAPLPAREFRRTDRLLMRVPTYDPGGGEVKVSARLMNRVGVVLVDLDRNTETTAGQPAQFDLSLARFAPGEYSLEVAANGSNGTSRQLIRFKITG